MSNLISNKWQKKISFDLFCKVIQQNSEQLYTELFLQHKNQFSIRNQLIAVKKLQRIIEATFVLANEVGFQAMTLRQLSKQTEMSMGGLYAYIQSKDDLAEIIYSFLNSYCEKQIDTLVDEKLADDDKLVALIHVHIYLSELMQPWFYFAYMETKNLSVDFKSVAIKSELSMENKITTVINSGITAGNFRKVQTKLIAPLIKSMLQDWYLKHGKYKKRKITVDQYATQVADIALTYLKVKVET